VQNGASFLSKNGKKAAFNTPAGIEAATWLVDKSGATMPTIADGQGTADFDTNLFTAGKLAMLHTGIWVFGSFADTPANWDIAVEPGNTTKASAMFTNGVVVNAASKNKDAAQKWIAFLSASDVTAKTRLATSWELPPVADETQLASYLDQKKPTNRKAVFESLEATVLPPVIERQQEMQDILTKELGNVAAGRKSVAKALADAESAVNALLG
jgi:multiple sugar transport system substrate-binding protein